jgi:hypothetical protein
MRRALQRRLAETSSKKYTGDMQGQMCPKLQGNVFKRREKPRNATTGAIREGSGRKPMRKTGQQERRLARCNV